MSLHFKLIESARKLVKKAMINEPATHTISVPGDEVADTIVAITLVLKIRGLSYKHTGNVITCRKRKFIVENENIKTYCSNLSKVQLIITLANAISDATGSNYEEIDRIVSSILEEHEAE